MPVAAEQPNLRLRFSRHGLFFRLSLLVLAPIALLTAAAVYNANREYAEAERSAVAEAEAYAHQAALRLDEYHDEVDQFLAAVAEIARAPLAGNEDGDPVLARMLMAMPQHVNGLSIVSLGGQIIATTTARPEARAKINVADRMYFKEALARRRLVVDEPLMSRTNSQWITIAARPVFDLPGNVIGVVSMSTRVDRIHSLLVPTGLPLGALMTVFSDRGAGIASTAEPLAAIGRDFTKSDTVRRAIRDRAFSFKGRASDGAERFAAYDAGEKLPWVVEVGLPVDTMMEPARDRFKLRLAFLAAALLLGLMAAAWLARWIGRPIRVLARDAEELGKGDLKRRTSATGYREVARLAASFNRMAGATEQHERDARLNEERFRSLVFLSSDWYWTQDEHHRFTSHTQGRFGDVPLTAEDFRGKTRWEMPGAEPVGASWAAHRALLDARRAWRDFIVRYADNQGAVQYIASSGEPVFDEAGRFTGYRGVARLVTDQYRAEEQRLAAEEALRRSEAKYRALTALSSDWYWEQDENYRFTVLDREFKDGDPMPYLGKTRWEAEAEPVGFTWDEHRALLDRRETFRNAVICYTTKAGTRRYVSANGAPMFGADGRFRGYRGTGADITSQVRLEIELKERMELLRVTLDTSPVCIALIRTRDNVALLTNRATNEIFQADPARTAWSVVEHWEREEDMRGMLRRIREQGYARDMEVPIAIPGRQRMWALLSAQPARYLGEDVLVVTLHDITGRKSLEAQRDAAASALRESEERLRATLDYSPNVAVQWYDRDGRIRFWNKASCNVFGWREDEVLGRTLDELGLYTPAQCHAFVEGLRAMDREGPRAEPAESAFSRKDGTPGVIVSTTFPIPSSSGERLYVCMDIDVTHRKRLESELRERIDLFGVTLDTTPVAMGLVRRVDNAVLLANEAGYGLFRVPKGETWNVLGNWKRREDLLNMLAIVERDGEARDLEIEIVVPGREDVWALLSAKPATYHGEEVLVVTVHDITGRRALERERDAAAAGLKASEAKFRALTALSSDWYWEQDAGLRFTHVGSTDPRWALPMLGKRRWELDGEPLGMTWDEHKAQLERGETFRNLVFRYTIEDGASAWLSVNGEALFGAAGEFLGYRGTATDVTRRYRLELELNERMDLFRTTLDTSPVSTALVRVRDNVVLLANRAAHHTFRVSEGGGEWNVMNHRDRPGDMPAFVQRIKRDGFVRDMEVPVLIPGRGRAWMLVAAQPGRFQGENVMVVSMHDITERKRLEVERDAAEAALRANEAKFRALTALSSDWYWEQDEHYRFTSYSTEFRISADQPLRLLGKTRWELHGQPAGETWDEHRACLERRETLRGKLFRYPRADGSSRYIAISGEPVFDEAGVFKGYRGTGTDVTRRVQLENEVKERVNLFQVTLDTMPVAIGLIRRDDNAVLLANRAAHELFRIEEGAAWNVMAAWTRAEDSREMFRRVREQGYAREMEAPLRVGGNDLIWTLISAHPARYEGEEVLVVTLTDITERRALALEREALLAERSAANERLRRLSLQLLDVQEAERRQIAHELHDEIGQSLSALKLFAGHWKSRVGEEARAALVEWTAILDTTVGQVRDLSRLLRPVQLDHMGLAPALRALLDTQARAAGWVASFEAQGEGRRADTRIETVCYRVLQEALNNAGKHAAAASVNVRLEQTAHEFRLHIEDDGRGFDVDSARARVREGSGMGLLGMEERVHLVGGSFHIDSAPAQGTRIRMVIPVIPAVIPAGAAP